MSSCSPPLHHLNRSNHDWQLHECPHHVVSLQRHSQCPGEDTRPDVERADADAGEIQDLRLHFHLPCVSEALEFAAVDVEEGCSHGDWLKLEW